MDFDENEIRDLRAQVGHLKNYETVFNALKAKPEARRMVNAAIKMVSPNTAIPEFDAQAAFHGAAQQLQAGIAPTLKKMDDFIENENKKRIETDVNTRIAAGHQYLRSRNYGKEGIDSVEKLMQERGIPDYEAAEALHARIHPTEEMSVPGSQSAFDVFAGDQPNAEDEFKRWAAGPKGREGSVAAGQEVRKILSEIRGGRAA